MSLSHRLVTPLLIGGLLLPTSTVLAQGDPFEGWALSDDERAFATNDSNGTPPGWVRVQAGTFPHAIAAIPGPDVLHGISGTLESGTRLVTMHDGGPLAWLDEGRTPVLAKAIVDDDGAAWTRQQHIISTPGGCSDAAAEMGFCVHPWIIAGLADQAAPGATPAAPAPFAGTFESGLFASTGATDHDGTLFSFAGDATVGTTVKVRNDDTIVVRGDVDIGDGLGGQLRGFATTVVPISADSPGSSTPPRWGPLESHAAEIRDSWAARGKAMRSTAACPSSRQGYVVSQFLIGGAGRDVGPSVDRNLEGGTPVLISEVIPFDCGSASGPGSLASGPVEGPAAALVCGSTRARHMSFRWVQDGETVISPSSLAEQFAIATIGLPPDTVASLNARIAGANGGRFFTVGLEGVQLDSATHPDAMLWLGESEAGIDNYGPKRFRDLEFSTGSLTFELIDQKRELLGEAFDVGPSQKPVSNCPEFDFTFDDVTEIFPDGFESGDVSVWSSSKPD